MLKLVAVGPGAFDLAFDDPALDDVDAAIATLVYAVLFTDAEAPAERVPDRFHRRGWWADSMAGSGLWYLRWQTLTDAARRETLALLRNSLASADTALTDISVKEATDAPAGSVSSVFVDVSGMHNGRKFIVRVPL